jgi:GTPase SAR1 family protein
VGNKNDLEEERVITPEEGSIAGKDELNAENFFETSAKTGHRVEETFEELAELLVNVHKDKLEVIESGQEI